ncbi:MAG: BofC C-terminal domain-containing protein [Syntrophomonadaceae bacterium]|nr:BofC C-terminal domain-containing protein [Syntrophomonadaceae bacterium]
MITKKINLVVLIAVLLISGITGYYIATIYRELQAGAVEEKPVMQIKEPDKIVNPDTQIIFEQQFSRCSHIVISEFKEREKVIGKNIAQLRALYPFKNGYQVNFKDNTLTIYQVVDGWCPQEEQRCRLKDYKGRIAIFQGPDAENDVLKRVTNLYTDQLPEETKNKILQGEYEFENMEQLNDALENFDEYL